MGIGPGTLMFMLEAAAEQPFEGRALTLGKQDVWFGREGLEERAARAGVDLRPPRGGEPTPLKHEFAERGFISDVELFEAIGFTECRSLDYSAFEGADFTFDLNEPEVPEELRGSFDAVFDLGTLEHVFHLPNALANVHRMLREGGRVMHVAPSSNHMDHGFYMFSPTVFWDFYTTNGWDSCRMRVFKHTPRPDKDPWIVYEYGPGALADVSYGGLDDGMYGICCSARKVRDSTGDRVPQQGSYLATWAEAPADGVAGPRRSLPRRIAARMYHSVPGQVMRRHLALRVSLKRRNLGLKVMDRFK